MKPKLVVVGAAGRMGRRILSLAAEQGRFEVIGAVEKKGHFEIGECACPATAGVSSISFDSVYPPGADVVVDFSSPEGTDGTVGYCLKNKSALVLGTTGLDEKKILEISVAAKKIPVLYSTNTSVGMNILFSLAGKAAKMLGGRYDIEIIEQHHRFKKDAPSGSALTLAENICKTTGRKFPDSLVYGREGKSSARKEGTIGVHSVRAGDITGVHSVIFSTMGETITLNHTAHSRDTFAAGALHAAEWLVGRKPALYSMADVLEMKSR